MRQTMPTIAAWIDDLRAAFGADTVNRAIRNGMNGGSQFYAAENGQTIGSKPALSGHIVCAADMVLSKRPPEPQQPECRMIRGRK
jgi:hypothetical protein